MNFFLSRIVFQIFKIKNKQEKKKIARSTKSDAICESPRESLKNLK